MSVVAVVTKTADRTTDDLGLVAAVRAGDDRAFELLFERYQGRIAAYVQRMVRDHGRAEDVTQEVFIAALRRMRATDREIAFKPWIYEIAKNACIDAFRRTRNVHEVSIDAGDALGAADLGRLAAAGPAADAVVDAKLAIDDLCGAFGGLSQTHHDILVMREFDGLSYREIGERLDMSRAAVESTLFRARRRLGEEYGEIASGERCLRVRAIVDARADRAAGVRDRRRMARHLSHCQPCRRYAHLAGVDLGAERSAAPAATKVAAMLPLPAFLRRRMGLDDAGRLLVGGHGGPILHWSPTVVSGIDPTVASGWSKAAIAAATVAFAGLGAGVAVKAPGTIDKVISQGQSIIGLGPKGSGSEKLRAPATSAVPSLKATVPIAANRSQHAATSRTVGGDSTVPGRAHGAAPLGAPDGSTAGSHGTPDAPTTRKLTGGAIPTLLHQQPGVATPSDGAKQPAATDSGSRASTTKRPLKTLLGGTTGGGSAPAARHTGAVANPVPLVGAIVNSPKGTAVPDTAPTTTLTAGNDPPLSTASDTSMSTTTSAAGSDDATDTKTVPHRRPGLLPLVGNVLPGATGAGSH